MQFFIENVPYTDLLCYRNETMKTSLVAMKVYHDLNSSGFSLQVILGRSFSKSSLRPVVGYPQHS